MEELFLDTFVNNCYESESSCNGTKIVRTKLSTKYENSDLDKTITKHCQNLMVSKQAELSTLLNKYQGLFNGSLGAWDTNLVDSKPKVVVKPVCSCPYPLPKAHERMIKKQIPSL